jgi:tether containing UBX domain for GLUT4
LVAENEKNSVFHSKKQEELERVRNQQVYTTSLIRIRFPDDYVIQGTFAALERVQVIYNFVKENLANPDREFYLYETPPKKIIKDLTLTAKAARLVPSGVLYFAWADLDQTLNTDGPFLDMFKLKDKITAF